MLMVNQLTGFGVGGGGGGPVAITLTANPAGNTPTADVATYSSQSIGTASGDRIVCLCVYATSGAGTTIASATIDYGTGAVSMTAGAQTTAINQRSTIFYASAPTGTTATFTITFTGGVGLGEQSIVVYSVTGANSTPAATGSDSSNDVKNDPLTTGSITIPANGAFLAVAMNDSTDNFTWSNATDDVDETDGKRITTATRTTSGTVTITAATDGSVIGSMSWITFNPA